MAATENPLADRAEAIFRAALDAVEPSGLMVRAIASLPTAIHRALESRTGRLVVVGAGKAVRGMAQALEDAIGEPASPVVPPGKRAPPTPPPIFGLVVAKRGAPGPELRRIRLVEAGHPIPDEVGRDAALEMLRHVASLDARDLVLAVLSGGASALLAAPPDGVSLADLRATTAALLASGATIDELNAVRKHLSQIAGGRLARASGAAALIAFALSDVPGDRLDTIAGGPTVPDPTTFAEALAILERRRILAAVPASVRRHLERGARGEIEESPKPGNPAFERARTIVIGSGTTALEAAARRAEALGYRTTALAGALRGEAREAGRDLARRLLARRGGGPACVIASGETTVALRAGSGGRGGRSQEVATAAALVLAGAQRAAFLAAGTDGEDGPTDAAGAIVDGGTAEAARAVGADLEAALARNDCYPALDRVGALFRTGPTGTNVADLAIGLIE